MTADPHAQVLHRRLERQLNALLSISRRWRTYDLDAKTAFRAVTEAAAEALAVERASVWLLDDKHAHIVCQDLYELTRHRHTQGFKLARRDHPDYFAALDTEDVVAATDAHNDPRTRSFRDGYLIPNRIGAMLDTPIRVGGKLVGVVCCEHVGDGRLFMADEQTTARLLANLASLACEIQARAESQRKEAHSHALFVAAVESAGIGVFASDIDGNLFFINERARQLWDFPDTLPTDAKNRPARLAFALERVCDPAAYEKQLRRLLDDPATVQDAYRIELKNGRVVESSSRPIVVGGTITGRVYTLRDVTKNK